MFKHVNDSLGYAILEPAIRACGAFDIGAALIATAVISMGKSLRHRVERFARVLETGTLQYLN